MMMIIALAMAASAAKSVEHKVQVDGRTFRVKVIGRSFGVFNKALFTVRTPEDGDLMRRAVKEATGCEPKDAYWEGAHMKGLLDCPASE